MADGRIVWDGYFSAVLPRGWEDEGDSKVISFFDPNGVGAIHISFVRTSRVAVSDLCDLNQRFAGAEGLGVTHSVVCKVGGFDAATFEAMTGGAEPRYWRVWHIGARGRVAFVSYTSSAEDCDVERLAVDALVASIEWLW